MSPKALEGLKVVEHCSSVSGSYCGKLLADLGAEVIAVEPPRTGHPARQRPPFPRGEPDPEKSGLFLFLSSNKLGITLDPASPAGNAILRRLAEAADVVIDDHSPGYMETLGLGYEQLRAANPGVVFTSITPFGRSGPRAGEKAYQLNIAHASGQGYVLPLPALDMDRPPVKIGGNCTEYDSGQAAATATLAALYARGVDGEGQLVEISRQEAVLGMQRVETVIFANSGEISTRKGFRTDRMITMMFECIDGYVVSVTPLAHQKASLLELIGLDPKSLAPAAASDAQPPAPASASIESLIEAAAAWMKPRRVDEVCARAQELSCPITPMSSAEQVAESPQFKARRFLTVTEHPAAGRVEMPAGPCVLSETPFALDRPAPRLGEHNEEVYCKRLGYRRDELAQLEQDGVI